MRDTRLVPSVFHFPNHHMTSGGYAKRVSPSAHARTLAYHTRSRSKWHLPHLTLDWIPPRSRSTCRACMRDTRLVPSVFHFPSHHMTSGGYAKRVSPSAHARTRAYYTRSRSKWRFLRATIHGIQQCFQGVHA